MAIRFRCCECSKLLSIGTRKAGTATPCPVCGTSQVVPTTSAVSRRSYPMASPAPQSRAFPVFSLGVGVLIILGSLAGIHALRQQSAAHSPEAAPIAREPSHIIPVEQQILAAVKLSPHPAALSPAKLVPTEPVAEAKLAETPANPAPIEIVQSDTKPEPAAKPVGQIAKDEQPVEAKQAVEEDVCPKCGPNEPKPARPDKGIQIAEESPRQTDRETFGTAVEFARNPVEAGKLAREERKLSFLLHVSGNFEDAGFT